MGDETQRDFVQYCDSPDFLEKEGIVETYGCWEDLKKAVDSLCKEMDLALTKLEQRQVDPIHQAYIQGRRDGWYSAKRLIESLERR